MTFSKAVNSGSRLLDWKTKPMARLRNSDAAASLASETSLPSMCSDPVVGRSRVPMTCNKVLLAGTRLASNSDPAALGDRNADVF